MLWDICVYKVTYFDAPLYIMLSIKIWQDFSIPCILVTLWVPIIAQKCTSHILAGGRGRFGNLGINFVPSQLQVRTWERQLPGNLSSHERFAVCTQLQHCRLSMHTKDETRVQLDRQSWMQALKFEIWNSLSRSFPKCQHVGSSREGKLQKHYWQNNFAKARKMRKLWVSLVEKVWAG